MITIRLHESLVDELLAQALSKPDEEVCGLISGRDFSHLEKAFPVKNVAENRCSFFEVDPEGQIDAMRQIRESGDQWVAIYHSHPKGPAYPSAIDLERSEYPHLLYLIIALQQPASSRVRVFSLCDRSAREVLLKVV